MFDKKKFKKESKENSESSFYKEKQAHIWRAYPLWCHFH